MVTEQEIVRALRMIRSSSRTGRQGRKDTSISTIAHQAGISRQQLYRIIKGESLGAKAREALSRVLSCNVDAEVGSGVFSDEKILPPSSEAAAPTPMAFAASPLISRLIGSAGVAVRRSWRR